MTGPDQSEKFAWNSAASVAHSSTSRLDCLVSESHVAIVQGVLRAPSQLPHPLVEPKSRCSALLFTRNMGEDFWITVGSFLYDTYSSTSLLIDCLQSLQSTTSGIFKVSFK
jgi:hypothetical protein